jgi:hypothetical protein
MTLQRNSIVCSLLSVALRELASFSSAMRSRIPIFPKSWSQQTSAFLTFPVALRQASAWESPLATPWQNISSFGVASAGISIYGICRSSWWWPWRAVSVAERTWRLIWPCAKMTRAAVRRKVICRLLGVTYDAPSRRLAPFRGNWRRCKQGPAACNAFRSRASGGAT